MKKVACPLAILLWLSACGDPNSAIDERSRNIIAVCSAGVGIETSASLLAELNELRSGGELSVAAERELRGALFRDFEISSTNSVSVFEKYISCVRGEAATSQFVALLEARKTRILGDLTESGVSPFQIVEISSLMDDHIDATQQGQVTVAHALHVEVNMLLIDAYADNDFTAGEIELYSP